MSNDLDTAIRDCLAAFDAEFKATFSHVYGASLCGLSQALHKGTQESFGDLEAVLPADNKSEKPKGDPQTKKKKNASNKKLPIDGSLIFKGIQNADKPYTAYSEALGEAIKHNKLEVHVQDWGVVNMDVEPHVFVQVCSSLGDFQAVTYKTIQDFNELHEILSKPDVHSLDGTRAKKVNMPGNISSLEKATLSSKPLKSKASRLDCACRKKTGLEQPHAMSVNSEGESTMATGVTNTSVISVGATYNPHACDTIQCAHEKDGKNEKKKDKKKKRSEKKDKVIVKSAAVQKLKTGSRTLPVWSTPQFNCHCSCPYCCWGEVAAEVLGGRLQAYLVALAEHCYSQELLQWLGFKESNCVSLVSFTYEQPGFINVQSVAAEALRSLQARTIKDANASANVPAFTNLWQASMNFNSPEEGLTWWIVSELIRTRMTRSVGDAKNGKRPADPDGRLFQEWLPGVTPLRPLNKDQIKARCFAKNALIEHVKPEALKHYKEIADSFTAFLNNHTPSQTEVDNFFDPLSTQISNDVMSQCLDGGVREAMQCLTKIVCVLLEKHVLTRAVMEPLANADSQMSQFVIGSVRDSSKKWDAEYEDGRRALAIASLTGTRYVVSSTIASGSLAFAADVASTLNEQKEELKSLSLENISDVAASLASIPTLVRAIMHVILSEAPASFVSEIAAYMVALENSDSEGYKKSTSSNKETLAKKWQHLREVLGGVAWRAGYLLEKSLVAQYVQQTCAEKGAGAKSGNSDPTVPADESGKKVKKPSNGKDSDVPPALHPYMLGFELEGVKKYLRALSETSAAAYWNVVVALGDGLEAFVQKSHDDGEDRVDGDKWKAAVRQCIYAAFQDSFGRMKAEFCNISVEMIVQYICDVISHRAVGEIVRKADAGAKSVADATAKNAETAENIQIKDVVDNIVSVMLKPTVASVVGEWKESALDRYHIVAETVTRATTFQSSENALEGSSAAFDTKSLSLGSNSYSGTGSFTSEDDEPRELEPEPEPEPETKPEPKPKPAPAEASESAHSASASSKSSSHYSSVSGSASRSKSESASGSKSGSASSSKSGSESGSSKSASSAASEKKEEEPKEEEPKEEEPKEEEPKEEEPKEEEPKEEEPKEEEPKEEEPKEEEPKEEEPKEEPKKEDVSSSEPAEEEENTASEMSEIVPFDRL